MYKNKVDMEISADLLAALKIQNPRCTKTLADFSDYSSSDEHESNSERIAIPSPTNSLTDLHLVDYVNSLQEPGKRNLTTLDMNLPPADHEITTMLRNHGISYDDNEMPSNHTQIASLMKSDKILDSSHFEFRKKTGEIYKYQENYVDENEEILDEEKNNKCKKKIYKPVDLYKQKKNNQKRMKNKKFD